MKTIYYFLLSSYLTIIVWLFISCDYTETISLSQNNFTLPNDSSIVYQLDKRYFLLIPGDTALFYGTKNCSIFINGNLANPDDIVDSLVLRTITFPADTITINHRPVPIFSQRYEYVSSLNDLANNSSYPENTISRFFIRHDTAIIQTHYTLYTSSGEPRDSVTYSLTDDQQKVIPRIIEVGKFGFLQSDTTNVSSNNKWFTSPIIPHPYFIKQESVNLQGFSVALKLLAMPGTVQIPYNVNGVEYRNGLVIRTYHTINGIYQEKGRDVKVNGSILILRTFFTDVGMVDQEITQVIHETFADTVQISKEHSYIARGPEGAKYYPEHIYP